MRLDPLVSRILALSVVAAAVALAAMLIWWPFGVLQAYDEEIAQAQDRVEQYERIAEKRAALVQQLRVLEQGRGSASETIRAGSIGIANSSLQQLATKFVTDAGARVESIQVLGPLKDERLTRIGLRLSMKTTIDVLRQVLYRIESSKPYLFIDNVEITAATQFPTANGAPAAVPLSIYFDVYGYTVPETGGAEPAAQPQPQPDRVADTPPAGTREALEAVRPAVASNREPRPRGGRDIPARGAAQ